jgi:transcriptional regulator with PAS, ATPase and Fis domain
MGQPSSQPVSMPPFLSRALERSGVIAVDPVSVTAIDYVHRYAQTSFPLMLTGETGSGKEVAARLAHELSARASGSFVAINCAALPESLAESELFGHERGAFTGAMSSRPGAFEAAHNGTIFLDEIGELPLAIQAKLLRVIEVGEVRRVGSDHGRAVNVRILAATHRNLRQEVQRGAFREDLYYRLVVCEVRLPALRERVQDIRPLCVQLLGRLEKDLGPRQLTEEAYCALERYSWPGNVRELRNVLQRAAICSDSVEIQASGLDIFPPEALSSRTNGSLANGRTIREIDRQVLESELIRCQWNRRAVARSLGIARSTVKEKIRRYGIVCPPTKGS